MSANDHLGAYADGWTNGDADKIIGSLADGYVLDDPNEGKITKAEFANFLAGMKEAVAFGSTLEPLCGLFQILIDAVTSVILKARNPPPAQLR